MIETEKPRREYVRQVGVGDPLIHMIPVLDLEGQENIENEQRAGGI